MTDSSDFPTSLGGATILLRRERDEARAEVDRLKAEKFDALLASQAEVTRLRALCDRVREARNAYPILHHDTCDHWTAPEPPNCTCGAWALRAAIEALGPGGGK